MCVSVCVQGTLIIGLLPDEGHPPSIIVTVLLDYLCSIRVSMTDYHAWISGLVTTMACRYLSQISRCVLILYMCREGHVVPDGTMCFYTQTAACYN